MNYQYLDMDLGRIRVGSLQTARHLDFLRLGISLAGNRESALRRYSYMSGSNLLSMPPQLLIRILWPLDGFE